MMAGQEGFQRLNQAQAQASGSFVGGAPNDDEMRIGSIIGMHNSIIGDILEKLGQVSNRLGISCDPMAGGCVKGPSTLRTDLNDQSALLGQLNDLARRIDATV